MTEALTLTPDEALNTLVARIRALAATHQQRLAIGLAGGPGTGKSTLAAVLVETLNAEAPGLAALVPMDGFHMRHAKLEALGLVKDKGAPHTFEGATFVEFVKALKASDEIFSVPGYSRKIEDVVENASMVPAEVQVLIIEGNYLLLPDAPWDAIRPLLDLAVFIDLPRELVRARLMRRHAEEGLFTEERNREHIERVDLKNYDTVSTSRTEADLIITLSTTA